MTSQLDIRGGAGGARERATELPEGFRYEPELSGPEDEAALLARALSLPYRDFESHGYTGRRRVVSSGETVGVSLLSPCVPRLRREAGEREWGRASVVAEPRSAYLLSGPARSVWEHSIPQTDALRYSVTFRTLREG